MIDIALNTDAGYYDISFTNGDFTLVNGLDTALLMSIFCEKRASENEVARVELRRGWWGNKVSDFDNYEIGSKLWELEQARRDFNTLNLAKTFTQDGLQWLVTDNLAKKVEVDSAFIVDGIEITINLVSTNNIILNRSYSLWNETGV